MAGDKEIRKAIQSICGPADVTWEVAQAQYRKLLYLTGGSTHQAGKATIPAEDIKAVLAAGGELTLAQVLRIRIPHMTRGLAMGMRDELEAFFRRHRKYFGPNRLTCARKFRINCKELKAAMMCARDLQI